MKHVLAILTPQQRTILKTIMDGKADLLDHDDIYQKLFDYYCESGEMPYGTMKARTGDPDQWIINRLQTELK